MDSLITSRTQEKCKEEEDDRHDPVRPFHHACLPIRRPLCLHLLCEGLSKGQPQKRGHQAALRLHTVPEYAIIQAIRSPVGITVVLSPTSLLLSRNNNQTAARLLLHSPDRDARRDDPFVLHQLENISPEAFFGGQETA